MCRKNNKLYTAKMLMAHFETMKLAASTCISRIEASLEGTRKLSSENPYRMVRLLRSVIANGNDRTAVFITNGSKEINFVVLCRVVLAHARPHPKQLDVFHEAAELVDIFAPRDDVKRVTYSSAMTYRGKGGNRSHHTDKQFVEAKKFDATVNRECYELGGLESGDGSDLLMLLVDFAYLLPLSEVEVRCDIVWTLIKKVIMPIIDFLNNLSRPMTEAERVVNGALIDLYENVLARIDAHGLLDALLAEQYRSGENMIEDLRDDLRFMKDCPIFVNSLSSRTRDAIERVILRVEGRSETIDVSK
jgi:hypothetical protein